MVIKLSWIFLLSFIFTLFLSSRVYAAVNSVNSGAIQEEAAIYKMCAGTAAPGACPNPPPPSGNLLSQFVNYFFGGQPKNAEKMAEQADTLDQMGKPEEIAVPQSNSLFDWLSGLIGSDKSFYVDRSPEFDASNYDAKKNETFYEDTIAPENVNPITGQP